jgi:hypothetical protein
MMSTNMHFAAEREVLVVKTGRTATQRINFDRTWQTPTRVTNEIMAGDPIQGYKDWVLREHSRDQILDVYAEDDYFEERGPIGTRVYNAAVEHVAEFEAWLEMCEAEGYTVVAEPW